MNVGAIPERGFEGNDEIDHESVRNFYTWLDSISEEVYKKYPWWPCLLQNRCDPDACLGGCCHHSAFLVSEEEFSEIAEHMKGFPKGQLDYIVERSKFLVHDLIQPRVEQGMSLVDICVELGPQMFVCPLYDIKGGICTVYDDRPSICRSYGHFLHSKHKIQYYSETVGRAILKHRKAGEKITLPEFESVQEAQKQIFNKRVALLPMWIVLCFG